MAAEGSRAKALIASLRILDMLGTWGTKDRRDPESRIVLRSKKSGASAFAEWPLSLVDARHGGEAVTSLLYGGQGASLERIIGICCD